MPAQIDSHKAAARALADFLGGPKGPRGVGSAFLGISVDTGAETGPYRLAQALDDWPTTERTLKYPAVSVTPVPGKLDDHDLGITFLENDKKVPPTRDPKTGLVSVLIKKGERIFNMQIDCWGDTPAQADAIKRAVSDSLDGSNQGQTPNLLSSQGPFDSNAQGAFFGLRLDVGAEYFNRTLSVAETGEQPLISEDQAFRDERRRVVFVDARIEEVKLVKLPQMRIEFVTQVGEAVQVSP